MLEFLAEADVLPELVGGGSTAAILGAVLYLFMKQQAKRNGGFTTEDRKALSTQTEALHKLVEVVDRKDPMGVPMVYNRDLVESSNATQRAVENLADMLATLAEHWRENSDKEAESRRVQTELLEEISMKIEAAIPK